MPTRQIPRLRFSEDALLAAAGGQTPVIIEGAAAGWPAFERWTTPNLRTLLADVRFPLVDGKEATIEDLLAKGGALDVAHSAPMKMYDAIVPERVQCRALLEDVRVPDWMTPDKLLSIVLWVTPAYNNFLHTDLNGCANLNYSIQGSKTAILYDPSELRHLYPSPAFELRVDPGGFRVSTEELPSSTELPDEPTPALFERFPRLREATAWEGAWEAGDALFIPPFWWHWIQSRGELNVNVTFWWWPEEKSLLNATTLRWAFFNLIDRVCGGEVVSPEVATLLAKLDAQIVEDPSLTSWRQNLIRRVTSGS